MTNLSDFHSVERLVARAREHYHSHSAEKKAEIAVVFTLLRDIFGNIHKLYGEERLTDSQEEASLMVLVQAVETVLAMFFLAESGFWTNSLAHKRNYVELMLTAIAIGYDRQCFIDWKHERSNFDSFKKIYKRVERSSSVPQAEKSHLPLLKSYWSESSQYFSHNVKRGSIRTLINNGLVHFEPKIASPAFQEGRMNTIRNMLLNVVSVVLGVSSFGKRAYEMREHFPEGKTIIDRANECFENPTLKNGPTK